MWLSLLTAMHLAVGIFKITFRPVLYLQIDRRIQAFMKRKRLEVDENNVQEFCQDICSKSGMVTVENFMLDYHSDE